MMMIGGGGCCISKYESDKMDRIMLRFRPIAPKPTTDGSSPVNTSSGGGDTYVKIERRKRRYKNNTDLKTSSSKRKKTPSPESNEMISLKRSAPIWLNFNSGAAEKDNVNNHRPIYLSSDPTGIIPPRVTYGTRVTLECLTYTMVNVDALGRTDNERVINLERDTCPGFVSDRLSRITWSNAAFSKMVGFDNIDGGWVAMKESVEMCVRAFSCRVRVAVEESNKTMRKKSKMMTFPCDVWRMDCGGFAWRLDVRAALSLAL